MGRWFGKSWFLVALLLLLPCGMAWGWSTSESWRLATAGRVQPALTTVAILFLMSFSLDSSKLRESFRTPKPVVWGAVVNLGLLPLLAWPLARTHSLTDLSLGLMIAASVPCTLATASVSTRQAGGNDAVSLLVTLLTNLAGVVLTPLWLRGVIVTHAQTGTAPMNAAQIDTVPIILNLALTVLLPTILGQLARLIPPLGRCAVSHKFGIGIVAQCLVLLIVTKTAVEAGGRLQSQEVWPTAIDFVRLAIECAGLHALAMLIAHQGSRWLGLAREDAIAILFAGSQKTLPVGLLLAAMPAVTGDRSLPFITFPILLFHAVQLVLDTAIADRIARVGRETKIPRPS